MPVTIWSQALVLGSGSGSFVVRFQAKSLSGFTSATQVRATFTMPAAATGGCIIHNWSIGIAGGGALPSATSLTKLTSGGGAVDTVIIGAGGGSIVSDFVTIGTFTSSDTLIVDLDIDSSSPGDLGTATSVATGDGWFKGVGAIPPNGEYNVPVASGYSAQAGIVYGISKIEIPDPVVAANPPSYKRIIPYWSDY